MGAPFVHTLRVRYNECDPQNHVFNANYLTYCDIAITELWREAFGDYAEAMAKLGVDLVVAEANVRYLAPLHFDDEFEIRAHITQIGETSIVTELDLVRDGTTCAIGRVRHVFMEADLSGKAPIPAPIREKLGTYAAET